MSRRRLTDKQRRTINNRVNNRKAPATDSDEAAECSTDDKARVIARYGKTADIEDDQGNLYRADIRATLQHEKATQDVVVGDWVSFQLAPSSQLAPATEVSSVPQPAVITGKCPPKTQLLRAVRGFNAKAVASNIDQLLIVWSPSPTMTTQAIEAYWVAAVSHQLKPILILNKVDLFDGEMANQVEAQYQLKNEFSPVYQDMGLDILEVSVKSGQGLAALKGLLAEKSSVIMGVSGVGKSSLVNVLLGESAMEIGALSKSLGSGMHTTTTARLLALPDSGVIIDSPGIREFQLIEARHQDLLGAYPDIAKHAFSCKFNNCSHRSEPGCSVREAVAAGYIAPWRCDNYLNMQQLLCQNTNH